MSRKSYTYRKIWIKHNGEIPVDSEGFSYEIHHRDNNHANNHITNLQLVTIREHLDIHLKQEDWFAAALIAKRIGLGPEYRSKLQTGKKRPGIGGRKKGCFNKGNKWSQEQRLHFSKIRKGRRHSAPKITDQQCIEILELYNTTPFIPNANTKQKNGKILSYDRAFAKHFCNQYNITAAQLLNIITGKRSVH